MDTAFRQDSEEDNRRALDDRDTMLESQGYWNVVRMPSWQVPEVCAVVTDLGRLVGSNPNPYQPLPGTRRVW